MNKRLEKERDERQRFSLRKLSVGLASVLVGVSFMAINAGQTVHADSLQTPSQPDSAVQTANNATNDTVNANEQNQTKSDTAHVMNHVDSDSNLQQNADKNTGATATNAVAKQKDNVTIKNNENIDATAKDDSNKVQENVNDPQNAATDQKEQTTVAFSVEKDNKPITANMLTENKIADAQNSDSNKGVDPVKFAANGGFDPEIWGTMDISKWQLDNNGNITGYTGDMSHIIIPNASDFAKDGKSYRQISISSDEMKKLGGSGNDEANTLAISLTADKKVKAANADWDSTFNNTLLKQANLEGLDTSNVTDMSNMFKFDSNSSLTSLDVSKWNTGNVTDMSHMFDGANRLTSLDLSKWNTSNVTNMSWMFFGTSSLTTLDVSNWDTSKVTNMSSMFDHASSLTSLNVSKWKTGNVTDMSQMFDYASGLTSLDVSKWNTSNVTDMSRMFWDDSRLTSLDVSNWDTSKVTSMEFMFYDVSRLTSLDVSKWDTSQVTDMHNMFDGAYRLTSLDVSKWNTSNVTGMSSMFEDSSLKSLDVSNWDTSKVTIMDFMFSYASELTLIANNPSGWQHATAYSAFNGVPVVITNNANILNVTDNGNYTIDGSPVNRSVIFDSANSALKLPVYKGYANYTSDADRLKYAADVIKVYNEKVMKDYSATHPDRTINYADDQDMNDPIALARAKFVTTAKKETTIIDNPENYAKLHATATREYIIHNIDGSTTTITQSINYHRTGKHNLVTNEDTFTEWIYSPDENSVVVVVTKDKNGKAIANPVTVEGDNCIERNGKAYFGSLKIKPKAGFKLAVDKPATAKLNLQAKLASRLLPRQFFVLKAFAPMPHKTAKPITGVSSTKGKQDHTSALAEPITSANAIKQGKDVIVKSIVKTIEPNEQATIYHQTHAGSPINDFAKAESQLDDVQNISMANSKQAKPNFNSQGSMQVANSSTENSQKSAADKARLHHSVTRTNDKVKFAETIVKSADSRQNQNKKVLAKKASAKPVANISTKAEKVAVKPAVNIPAKAAQPATQKIATIAKKQTSAKHSLPQTSSANNLGATVIGLIMSGLGIVLAGIKKRE